MNLRDGGSALVGLYSLNARLLNKTDSEDSAIAALDHTGESLVFLYG